MAARALGRSAGAELGEPVDVALKPLEFGGDDGDVGEDDDEDDEVGGGGVLLG